VNNINFIKKFLTENPGSKGSVVRRALAAHNGKTYRAGYYAWYFASPSSRLSGRGCKKLGADYGYWVMRDGVWYVA